MHRSMPLWVLAVALLIASACSSAANTSSAPAQQSATTAVTTPPAAPAPAVEFEASFEFLDEAAERMAAAPYRSEIFFAVGEREVVEVEDPSTTVVSDGTWVMVTQAAPPTETGGSLSFDEPASISFSNRTDFYMYEPQLSMFPPEVLDPVSRAAVEGWVYLRRAEIEAIVGADLAPTMNPRTFLTADDMWVNVRDAISIAEGPRSTIRGVETRSIVIETEQLEGFAPSPNITLIAIDAEGYVHSIVEDVGRIEFFDIGDADIKVEPPVGATDMTEAWLDKVEEEQRALLAEE